MNGSWTRRNLLALVTGLGASLGAGVINRAVAWPQTEKTRRKPGNGFFMFPPHHSKIVDPIPVWTYLPELVTATSPILFVMTGAQRDGKACRDLWSHHSRNLGAILLVPEFSIEQYPAAAYQQGNIINSQGLLTARPTWSFAVIEALFDYAKALYSNQVATYSIYGHSGGGQFVQRMVLLMPEARYQRAIIANAGFYTFPDPKSPYPYGLGGLPQSILPKADCWHRDVVVLLGQADTNANDRELRHNPLADAQGLNRYERGLNFFHAAETMARQTQTAFSWHLLTVPAVGHAVGPMAAAAAPLLQQAQAAH